MISTQLQLVVVMGSLLVPSQSCCSLVLSLVEQLDCAFLLLIDCRATRDDERDDARNGLVLWVHVVELGALVLCGSDMLQCGSWTIRQGRNLTLTLTS